MGGRGSTPGKRVDSAGYTSLSSETEDAAFFESSVNSWKNNLSNHEEVALSEYTMYTNKQVNNYLRDGTVSDYTEEELQRYVRDIGSALDKFDLKNNVTLYRAGDSKDVNREFKSFVSASTSREQAEQYLGRADTLYVIQVSKGMGKGAYVASLSEVPEEREFLLNKNLKIKRTRKTVEMINGKKTKVVTIQV